MSAGIEVPGDRTTSQQARGYCLNPECAINCTRFEFDVEHDGLACPKCGSNSPLMVGLLVLIHFLVRDQKGPIAGSEGMRYRLACDRNRVHLATNTNKEAASGDIRAVNCQGCLQIALHENFEQIHGGHFDPQRLAALEGRK